MMKKYIAPSFEKDEMMAKDIISASGILNFFEQILRPEDIKIDGAGNVEITPDINDIM